MVEKKKLREGYKKTEVGVIPEDWDILTLDDVGEFRRGKGIAKKELTNEGVPCVLYGEIYTKYNFVAKYLSSFTSHECSKKSIRINKGDVLFTGSGETVEDIGKSFTYLGNEIAFAGGDIILMTPYSQYDSAFLGYLTNYDLVNEQKAKLAQGSSVIHIYIDGIKSIIIPSPPLNEQKVIAKTLTDTDNLIQSIKNLIDKKEKIKQGTMQELLTGKKRLDGFSGDWEIKNLYELVEFINGKAHENFISDIGKYIVVNSRFVSTEGNVIKYSNQGNCLALTNDILMVMSDVPNGRAIAKCYYVEEDNRYTINQRVCILRSKDIISKFLFYVVDRNSHYLSFDDGVKQTNLKRDDVLNLNIKVPPLNEQKAISHAISDMDQEIQALEEKLDKYKTIKQGMMQELLTGRIRLI